MALLVDELVEAVLRERGVIAADLGRLVALHRIVDQVRPAVRGAEVDAEVELLPGGVVHGRAVAVVGENHQPGEALLFHQAIEVLPQAIPPGSRC